MMGIGPHHFITRLDKRSKGGEMKSKRNDVTGEMKRDPDDVTGN